MHNVTENSDCCRYCHKSYFNTRNTKYHEKLLTKFRTKQEFERSTNRSWSISGRHFVHQNTRVTVPDTSLPTVKKIWRENNEGLCWLPRFRQKLQTYFRGMPLQWARRRVRSGSLFNAIFFYFEDGSNTMKGRSREAKGDKNTGGGRTWYEKQKTLTPCPPPPNS